MLPQGKGGAQGRHTFIKVLSTIMAPPGKMRFKSISCTTSKTFSRLDVMRDFAAVPQTDATEGNFKVVCLERMSKPGICWQLKVSRISMTSLMSHYFLPDMPPPLSLMCLQAGSMTEEL